MSEENQKFRNQYIYRLNDRQKEKIYEKFIEEQEEQFELYINYINEVLIILKDYRIVSKYTKMNARIKSTDSATDNDGEKALDDVFGMEVDFATPRERDFVEEVIKSTMNISKEKIHKKDNGYEAHHLSGYPTTKNVIVDNFEKLINKTINPEEEYKKYYEELSKQNKDIVDSEEEKYRKYFMDFKTDFELYAKSIRNRISETKMQELKNDLQQAENVYLEKQKNLTEKTSSENIPIVEFQGKTIQIAIEANLGEARHEGYKGMTSAEMQEEYDRLGGKISLSKVPTMYTSDLKRDEDGNVIPMRLRSVRKTLEELYPELITNRKNKQERGE